jgi:hypothetical protein
LSRGDRGEEESKDEVEDVKEDNLKIGDQVREYKIK